MKEPRIKIKLQSNKKDSDFQTFDNNITTITQPTELGETLKELNADSIDHDIRLSSIDMRTRLYPAQVPSMVALDTIISLGVLPSRVSIINRAIMRKSVSIDGLGRKEFVEVIAGKREQDAKTGLNQRIQDGFKSFFGVNK